MVTPAQYNVEIVCPECTSPHHQVRSTRVVSDPALPEIVRVRYHICRSCEATFKTYVRRSPLIGAEDQHETPDEG